MHEVRLSRILRVRLRTYIEAVCDFRYMLRRSPEAVNGFFTNLYDFGNENRPIYQKGNKGAIRLRSDQREPHLTSVVMS
jgi:hypothetical protein